MFFTIISLNPQKPLKHRCYDSVLYEITEDQKV